MSVSTVTCIIHVSPENDETCFRDFYGGIVFIVFLRAKFLIFTIHDICEDCRICLCLVSVCDHRW